jgi:hypothetical protein
VYFTYISTHLRLQSRLHIILYCLVPTTRRQTTTIDLASSSPSSSCQRTEATSARDQRRSRSSPQCSSPQITSGTGKTPDTSNLWSGRACWGVVAAVAAAATLILIHHRRASADHLAILVTKTGVSAAASAGDMASRLKSDKISSSV